MNYVTHVDTFHEEEFYYSKVLPFRSYVINQSTFSSDYLKYTLITLSRIVKIIIKIFFFLSKFLSQQQ